MTLNNLKILAIDDNRDNLLVLQAVLSDNLPGAKIMTAQNGPSGLQMARAEEPDVILLDIVMPDMDGYEVCRRLKADEQTQTIPVLVLTALRTDRNSRIKALETGAEGFLAKPFDEVELIAQIRAMAKVKVANNLQQMEKEQLLALVEERTRDLQQEIAEKTQAEVALLESNRLMDSLLQTIPFPLDIVDRHGRILFMSSLMAQVVGKNTTEGYCWELYRDNRQQCSNCPITLPIQIGKTASIESHGVFGGRIFEIFHTGMFYKGQEALMEIFFDITERTRAREEREKLQAQFIQAQKMESVGRLAGGVAHDFNNMLGVILGYVELVMDEVEPTQPIFEDLQEIRMAAERSADLTRQLLAFARKQVISLKVLDLNEVIEDMLKMLRRLMGEDIDLVWLPGTGLWPIKMDPSQIDQLLANLCVNARDAIVGNGKVTIKTERAVLDEAYCYNHEGFSPGEYVLLVIIDNGCGMENEILNKVFEPFFTTKEKGQGTGLGLATVYGVIKQNNGFINISSEPGQGTTIKIYVPRHTGQAEQVQQEHSIVKNLQGHETILLVEDELATLKMATALLKSLGYTVLSAATPSDALELANTYGGQIHLLMTDVIMPEMNGRDLAKQLLKCHPDLKQLFISGYTADVIAHHGVLHEGIHFIQKPFSKSDLALTLRELLENDKDYDPTTKE